MDGTICQNKKDVVDILTSHLGRVLVKRLDDGPEEGRTGQLYRRQVLLVGLKHTGDPWNRRLHRITVECEAVGNLTAHGTPTEAKCREQLVAIVGFQDCTDLADSIKVLVLGTYMVERGWTGRVPIRSSKVDGDGQGDLPATAKVVHEAWHLHQIEGLKFDLTLSRATT